MTGVTYRLADDQERSVLELLSQFTARVLAGETGILFKSCPVCGREHDVAEFAENGTLSKGVSCGCGVPLVMAGDLTLKLTYDG